MTYFLHHNGCMSHYELFTGDDQMGQRKWVKKGCGGEIRSWADPVDAIRYATNAGGHVKMAE
jgi:hypothetical protein